MSGPVATSTPALVSPPTDAPKRGLGRPVQPCGTYAAYERHRRAGQTPCEPCKSALSLKHAQVDERRRKIAAAETAPTVTVKRGRVLIDASLEDARILAAAALDRVVALQPNRYTATTPQMPEVTALQIEKLRGLHKALAGAVRADG